MAQSEYLRLERGLRAKRPRSIDLIRLSRSRIEHSSPDLDLHAKRTGFATATTHGELAARRTGSFAWTIVQIVLFDMLFSLDSVITAVGVADKLGVMVAAIVSAMVLMLVASGPLATLVDRNLSVPKTRFGRIGDVVHREQDVTLGRQGAESDDAPARLC